MQGTAPKWFTAVSVIALLWNLMGLAAVFGDMFVDPSTLTDAQRALHDATPLWAVVASLGAVMTGSIGSLALILRKAWAALAMIVSLICVVVQDIWLFVLGDVQAVYGQVPLILQGLVLIIAVALVWLAKSAKSKGWLR